MRTHLRSGIKISLALLLIICSTEIKSQPQPTYPAETEETSVIKKQENIAAEDPLYLFSKAYPVTFTRLTAEFKTIKELKYSVAGKNLFLSFKSEKGDITSVYSTKGKMRYSITSLGTTLPIAVREVIREEYPGYTVFYGRHIKTKTEAVYHIILENQSGYRILNLINGETEEVKSIKK